MSSGPISPTLLGGLTLALVVVTYLYRRERAGDRMTALLLVLALLVVDSALFPAGGSENGLFIVPIRSYSFPLLFLAPLGIMAVRLAAGRWRPHFSVSGLCWLGFLGWIVAEAYAGHVRLNSTAALNEQAKVLVYLGVTAVLAAGVPASQWLGRRGIPFIVACCTPVALILIVTKSAGLHTNTSIVPRLVKGADTGTMGADCATVFVTLGLFGLALALTKPEGQRKGVLPAILLIICPAFTGQRASLIGAGVGLLLLALVAVSPPGRGLFHVPSRERAALGLLVLVAAGGFAVASASHHGYNPSNSDVAHSFTSQGKADSASARVNQWRVAESLIKQEPVLGHGLGVEYNYVEPVKDAPAVLVRSDLTHDIFLDALLRTGIVGCTLLVLALLASLLQGLRFLRLHVGGAEMAAVAVAGTAALSGWLARAAVESAFEKDRLAMALGLILGIGSAIARARQDARDVVASRPWNGSIPASSSTAVAGPAAAVAVPERAPTPWSDVPWLDDRPVDGIARV
jgi:O-antigen ligase